MVPPGPRVAARRAAAPPGPSFRLQPPAVTGRLIGVKFSRSGSSCPLTESSADNYRVVPVSSPQRGPAVVAYLAQPPRMDADPAAAVSTTPGSARPLSGRPGTANIGNPSRLPHHRGGDS